MAHKSVLFRSAAREEIQRFLSAAEEDDAENAVRWAYGQAFNGGKRSGGMRVPQYPWW